MTFWLDTDKKIEQLRRLTNKKEIALRAVYVWSGGVSFDSRDDHVTTAHDKERCDDVSLRILLEIPIADASRV